MREHGSTFDEAACDSFAIARALSRFGDDAELPEDPSPPYPPNPDTLGHRQDEPETTSLDGTGMGELETVG